MSSSKPQKKTSRKVGLDNIISIDLVAENILNLRNFSSSELLKLALVNKRWKAATRRTLLQKYDYGLKIRLETTDQSSNMNKIRWLQSPDRANLFNSIKVEIPESHDCGHKQKRLLSCLKSATFLKAGVYILSIEDGKDHDDGCQAFEAMKLFCNNLSHEPIGYLIVEDKTFEKLFKMSDGSYMFSSVTGIQMRADKRDNTFNFRSILNQYPKLTALRAPLTIPQLVPFISLEKVPVVRMVFLSGESEEDLEILRQFGNQQPKLEILATDGADPDTQPIPYQARQIFRPIFASSQDTLVKVDIPINILHAGLDTSTRPMKALEGIACVYLPGYFPRELFSQVFISNRFPILTTVELKLRVGQFPFPAFENIQLFPQDTVERVEGYTCPSVTNVIFTREEVNNYYTPICLEPSVLQKVAQAFPSVQKFSYSGRSFITDREFYITLNCLSRASWKDLSHITIGANFDDLTPMTEAFMFGITPEERGYWLEMISAHQLFVGQEIQLALVGEFSLLNFPKLKRISVRGERQKYLTLRLLIPSYYGNPGWVNIGSLLGPYLQEESSFSAERMD